MNFVVVIADDMRSELLDVMPKTTRLLTPMTNCFVANPVCGASRVSMLTGNYSRTTGIYGNNPPFGCYKQWHAAGADQDTIATRMHDAGYRTGLMGKYLNEYNDEDTADVGPGWDYWLAITSGGALYFDTLFSFGGESYRMPPDEYLTDFLADQARQFILSSGSQPFLLWCCPVAPHKDWVPAPRHADAFADLAQFRPRSFNEPDIKDKPAWYASQPLLDEVGVAEVDVIRLQQYRTVLALDELVAAVDEALVIAGVRDDTLVMFISDNGYLWGEHRLVGKDVPYVPSTRVPFAVRWPDERFAPNTDALIQNVDIAPTILELAGLDAEMDGRSLLKPLTGDQFRETAYVEHNKSGQRPAFAIAQRHNRTYTLHGSGEEEFYNLTADPEQLNNKAPDGDVIDELRAYVQEQIALGAPPGWE